MHSCFITPLVEAMLGGWFLWFDLLILYQAAICLCVCLSWGFVVSTGISDTGLVRTLVDLTCGIKKAFVLQPTRVMVFLLSRVVCPCCLLYTVYYKLKKAFKKKAFVSAGKEAAPSVSFVSLTSLLSKQLWQIGEFCSLFLIHGWSFKNEPATLCTCKKKKNKPFLIKEK